MEEIKCLRCGSKKLDSGQLMSVAKMTYQSDKKPVGIFSLFKRSNWPFPKARLCQDCGHLELYYDINTINKIWKK